MGEVLTRVERGVGLRLVALLAAAGATACSGSGAKEGQPEASAVATPSRAAAPTLFKGVVVNALDHRGLNVGVRTYVGPNSKSEAGHQAGGAHPYTDCITPGRTVVDTDVPAGVLPTESHNWYRLVADQNGTPTTPEWIGDGYYHVQTPGTVPQCTPDQIAGK